VVINFLEEKVEKTFYPYHLIFLLQGTRGYLFYSHFPGWGEGCGEGNLIMQSIIGD
jgi:hypothetical protein